ncbi:pyruvate:ferredoxin (flavodoxin) oxidoreductase [bacterium]|nr:MAG: pyruvate:ferredoxin (flavodoxin) oxidoreductase [bacterium]
MSLKRMLTVDGNEAVASVAHRLSEIAVIYPITPSSTMGEHADEWSAAGQPNIWGTVPKVVEMQSEGGAAGAFHGALQSGSLVTTFTASQGLLLMIPNMYKIAGELTPFVIHCTARSLAVQSLSIFGDQGDVMSVRQTGFAMLASNSPQEAHDLAAIAHTATLTSRIPFLHFFDGFRTSHEVAKINVLGDDDLRNLICEKSIHEHRNRALTPDKPVLRGSSANPDSYFQIRERINLFYDAVPAKVQNAMEKFQKVTGRSYRLFDYVGHPEAERVIVIMGSGGEAVHETVEYLASHGEKVGCVKVRLFRPFSIEHLMAALPATVKGIAVMDRCKESGAIGEPLYIDIISALREARVKGITPFKKDPVVIGGRYGLSSKEFNPAMIKAVFAELKKKSPKLHFTIGINDDVSGLSLSYDETFDIEPADVVRAVFFGLGADGTVGANKNSIKIIGEGTDFYAQGYFVYDSKKSGGTTISHLRFGPRPIRSTFTIHKASFVACHQHTFLERFDMLSYAQKGATFLLNTPVEGPKVWDSLPCKVQEDIIAKKIKVYHINAGEVARKTGMGGRINTVMQTCFFAISGVLPKDEAIAKIKEAIEKTYGKKGKEVVKKNFEAVDQTVANLFNLKIPKQASSCKMMPPTVSDLAPDFVKNVTAMMMAGKGDLLPVSAFSPDGTWPTGTTKWEKRNIAHAIPVWEPERCIQCAKCSMTCPHAAIRVNFYDKKLLKNAPKSFLSADSKVKEFEGMKYTVQVAAEDCTGCGLCVRTCPAADKADPSVKAINLKPHADLVAAERENFNFFLSLPLIDRKTLKTDIRGSQLREPLFEFSGSCAGCGETPYVKLLTQLFGDRLLIANATGCSSIYGGNLPTTPYTKNAQGRGPAWANSLFEDNAEFGLGFRLSIDKHKEYATEVMKKYAPRVGEELVGQILAADQSTEAGVEAQRARIVDLKARLAEINSKESKRLIDIADYLVKKSVWILGGDGWAYDIGYGGLDHVLATGYDVNVLVMDTEVYSNTGGQQSKATPLAAAAKFAAAGKPLPKKDLGMIAMTYGNIYVAQVALGARDLQTIRAMEEADSYQGPSLVIAYSHCIAHGFDLSHGNEQQKLAVESGHWPLYRFDPRRSAEGENPLKLDSGEIKVSMEEYAYNETRYKMLKLIDADRASKLMAEAQKEAKQRYGLYQALAALKTQK